MIEIVLGLASELVLFMYSIGQLSGGLHALAGERLRRWMAACTSHMALAICLGTVVTALLGSSSAAIVMLIALVDSRILGFAPAVGVVMGCNIGTTLKSQLVAFNMGPWMAIPMVAGFLVMCFSKEGARRNAGQIFFAIGMVFFSLQAMEHAVEPLKSQDRWMEWVTGLENPLKGTLAGTIISAVIQTSSGTVAMVIAFAAQGLMTFPAALGIMLGAELGTCADTLIASIGRRRAALKTGLFHLAFNVAAVALALLLIGPFADLVQHVSRESELPRKIANAHVLFNVLSVGVLAWFAPWFRRAFDRLLPEREGG